MGTVNYEDYLVKVGGGSAGQVPERLSPAAQSSASFLESSTRPTPQPTNYDNYLRAIGGAGGPSQLEQLVAGETPQGKNILGLPANRPMKGFWDTVFNPTEAVPLVGGLSTAYKKNIGTHANRGLHEAGSELMSQLGFNTSSVPINAVSRLPAAVGSTALDLLGGTIEQAPDMAVLTGLGRVMRAFNVWGNLSSVLEPYLPNWLKAKGGVLPSSAKSQDTMQQQLLQTHQESMDVAEKLLTAGGTRKLSKPERQFMGVLLQQPAMRERLAIMNAEEFPANRAALAEEAQYVPGRVTTALYEPQNLTAGEGLIQGPAASPLIPKQLSLPPKTFANVTQEVAEMQRGQLSKIADFYEKNPDELSRLNELNYSPIMYAKQKMGLMPTVSMLLREPGKGWLRMRREMTEEARTGMGEILDPVGPVSLRYAQQGRMIATRNLFNDYAANPMVTRDATVEEGGLASGMKGLDGFVKMPIVQSLGPLSGKMVRAEEAAGVNAMVRTESTGMKIWKDIFQTWRFGKTILSPATHVNNFISNIMLADAAGLSPYRMDIYAKAAQATSNSESPWAKEIKANGAPWVLGGGTQLAGDILDIQKSIGRNVTNAYEHFARTFADTVTKNAFSQKSGELYQASESLFKNAIYIKKRMEGLSPADAIRAAQDAIFDYSDAPMWVKQSRTTVLPFITFTYKVAPQMARAAVERPQVFLRWKIFLDTWNNLAAESAQVSPKERAEIEANFNDGFAMLSPFRDANGNPLIYNVARKTPVSDFLPGQGIFPRANDLTDLLSVPANVVLKNPVAGEALSQAMGRDARTGAVFAPPAGWRGQAISAGQGHGVTESDLLPALEQIAQGSERGKHLLKTVLPEVMGGGATQNILDAIRGRSDFLGQQRSVPRALVEALISKGSTLESQQVRNAFTLEDLEKLAALFAARNERKNAP